MQTSTTVNITIANAAVRAYEGAGIETFSAVSSWTNRLCLLMAETVSKIRALQLGLAELTSSSFKAVPTNSSGLYPYRPWLGMVRL